MVAPLRSLVLSAKETDCGSVAVYLPVLAKPKNTARGTLKNLSLVRRHRCSAHQRCSLRGYHSSTRRVAAESPLRGGASASSGPPPPI